MHCRITHLRCIKAPWEGISAFHLQAKLRPIRYRWSPSLENLERVIIKLPIFKRAKSGHDGENPY